MTAPIIIALSQRVACFGVVAGGDPFGLVWHQVLTKLQTGLTFGEIQAGSEFGFHERSAERPEHPGE